jgi:hypothetical protein
MTKHLKEVDRLQRIIEAFPKVTITVLGDLVADEFVFGEISRVSREAPVLILKHRERTVVPGGGANAVNNLADLGVNVLPVGAIGDDEPGRMLLKYFPPQADSSQRRVEGQELHDGDKDAHSGGHDAQYTAASGARGSRTAEPSEPHLTRELFLAAREICACLGCAAGFRLRLWIGDVRRS